MKFTHKFMILGLSLSSVACGGVDKKSEDAAERSCSLAVECNAQVDENECISDRLDVHADIKDKYGSDCLSTYLDVEDCIFDQFSCEDVDDADGEDFLNNCADQFLDVLDVCGLDFNIDNDVEFDSDDSEDSF